MKFLTILIFLFIHSYIPAQQALGDDPENSGDCEWWIGDCEYGIYSIITRPGNVGIGFVGPVEVGYPLTVRGGKGIHTNGIRAFGVNPLIAESFGDPTGTAGTFLGSVGITHNLIVENSIRTTRLDASENIFSKRIEVTTPPFPPDYVFEENYELMPIEELSKFLKDNKHLPGIPSAQEMLDTEKLDIADFQFKLLEKIEELALYIIELNREIEELKLSTNR